MPEQYMTSLDDALNKLRQEGADHLPEEDEVNRATNDAHWDGLMKGGVTEWHLKKASGDRYQVVY